MQATDLKTLSDEELVDLILASRNSKIFEEIYDRYAGKVFNKCLSFTGNKGEAEDYTHDVLVKVFVHLSTFKKGSKFSTWLYAITYNYCVDKQKVNNKEQEQREQYSQLELDPFDELQDQEVFQIKVDRLKIVMDMLLADERMILLLKYQDELSIKQLSVLFKINGSAVKMRLKRSKAKLLTLYKDKYAHNIF